MQAQAQQCNALLWLLPQGRADYHAPFVNLAARMLAAAHSGQVVTSIELAQSIFRWGGSSSSRTYCHR
jgi:class 3 adenylate cyclase